VKITGLEIIQVAASPRGNWIFVRLHTDAGLTGLGEASQSGNDALVCAALRQLGDRLTGADPTQVEVLWERMVRTGDVFSGDSGRIGATAVSAVDQAAWDIAGKALGVPVWQLLGGRHRDKVWLYANLNRGTLDRSPEGFAVAARRAVDAGFTAVKATPFDEVDKRRLDRPGVWGSVQVGLTRLERTRDAIGADVELLVDCHGRFDRALAQRVAEAVRDLELYWLEEPVARTDVASLAEITRSSGQRIAGGEAFFGREGFWDYVAERAVHVIMPDVKHAGGITECRRIAQLAEVAGIAVAPHNPAGPVSTMASVHLAAAMPHFLTLEYATGEVDWRSQLVQPAEVVKDGFVTVPEQPGLGLCLDDAVLACHRLG
jgi:galactonate dehydratase